jgi:hypothetical protein
VGNHLLLHSVQLDTLGDCSDGIMYISRALTGNGCASDMNAQRSLRRPGGGRVVSESSRVRP